MWSDVSGLYGPFLLDTSVDLQLTISDIMAWKLCPIIRQRNSLGELVNQTRSFTLVGVRSYADSKVENRQMGHGSIEGAMWWEDTVAILQTFWKYQEIILPIPNVFTEKYPSLSEERTCTMAWKMLGDVCSQCYRIPSGETINHAASCRGTWKQFPGLNLNVTKASTEFG